jgi:hypothetical protein
MGTDNLMKEYRILKDKYDGIIARNSASSLEKIYLHEVGNIINTIDGFKSLYEEGMVPKEMFDEAILANKDDISKASKLYPITEITDFSKEGLKDSETSVYEIFSQEKKSLESQHKVQTQINGETSSNIGLNSSALNAFISTNMGDAAKWTPAEEPIKVNVQNEFEKMKITIENKFGDAPVREEIGMGQKIGSRYTQLFLDAIGGPANEEVLEGHPYGTYKKTFTIPRD